MLYPFGLRPAWMRENDVTTGESASYPELQPQTFAADPVEVFASVVVEAARIPRWRVVSADPATRIVTVEVTTALFHFVDDLTARVEPAGPGQTRVVIRSHSRVGRGDLGENARHIAALQRRLRLVLGKN